MSSNDKIRERIAELKASGKENITISVNKKALELFRDKCKNSNLTNMPIDYFIDDLIKRDILCYNKEK